MNSIIFLTVYVIVVNVIGFALMGIDKHKAKVGAFRIPEGTLFVAAVIIVSINVCSYCKKRHTRTTREGLIYDEIFSDIA